MADWYVSSAAYASVAVYTISTAYTVGQLVQPTAPALKAKWVMRCTVAGTSAASEPTWPTANNGTVVSGGATFANVTGQSAFGWTAPAGDIPTLLGAVGVTRFAPGDRMFVSSDHSETQTTATTYGASLTTSALLGQVLSVNRAGSVPPVAADLLPGATATVSAALNMLFETFFPTYHYGMTYINTGGAVPAFIFATSGLKMSFFDTCQFYLNGTSQRIQAGTVTNTVFYNTTFRFGSTGQFFASQNWHEITWINTPSALPGAIFPNVLFSFIASPATLGSTTVRGVDLSSVTGTLVQNNATGSTFAKALFDSCRIAPGVVRYLLTGVTGTRDEVELVNCYDGTNILNERYQVSGAVTTEFTITLSSGGAKDNVGAFSHEMVSTTNIDKYVNPLFGFWMDVNNTSTGSSKTATVEILSAAAGLNNDEVSLELEYFGTSGSSLTTFANSLPTNVLAIPSAVPTSTAIWNAVSAVSTWSPIDNRNMALSGGNLVATGTGVAGGTRGTSTLTTGKYYWEYTLNTFANASTGVGIASPTAVLTSVAQTPLQASMLYRSGGLWVNNAASGSSLGTRANGDVIGIALDVSAQLIWFRVAPSGNWNGSGTANPATGVGGLNIGALGSTLMPCFAVVASDTDVATANFGASGFTGTAPSGFTSTLPTSGNLGTQKLQVTFTPQQAGRVRGRVRLGKTSTTVYYDPRITIT